MGVPSLDTFFLIDFIVIFVVSVALMRVQSGPATRPERLIVRHDALIAPPNWWVRLAHLLPLILTTALFAALLAKPIPSDAQGEGTYYLAIPTTIALAACTIYALAYHCRAPLALTSTGLRLGLRSSTWATLDNDEDQPMWFREFRWAPLRKRTPMDADPRFVRSVVEHYLENPDARAAIGQPEEYDRMIGALPYIHPGVAPQSRQSN